MPTIKSVIFILIAFLFVLTAQSQLEKRGFDRQADDESVTAYIRDFIRIVKHNSVFTELLNWPLIEKDVAARSAGLKTIREAKPVLENIIQELRAVGDNHSFILSKLATERYEKENSNPAKPEAWLMPGNLGYISVPGFSSTNSEVSVQFADDIQRMISKLDTENQIVGWIVDLRGNDGGNMYPMIAGLGPLTGEGTLGYFIEKIDNKEMRSPWFYRNGRSGAGSLSEVRVTNPYTIKNKTVKVAVLIGSETSSSGEMTAISFIGKRNVKLFGAPSGGYTTGNAMFELSDGSSLLLASSYAADRDMKRYMNNIIPHVVVSQRSDGVDADVKTAEAWLLGKYYSWEAVFLANIPLLLLIIPMTWFGVPDSITDCRKPQVLTNAILLLVGMILFSYTLKSIFADQYTIWGTLIIAFMSCFFAMFVLSAKTFQE